MKIAAIVLAALAASQAPVEPVLERLDRYLLEYEPRLSELVADELMAQELKDTQQGTQQRRLQSEVAFIWLPNDAGWLGLRHVLSIDHRETHSRSLATVLREPSLDPARRLLLASAEHNLGNYRTINLPNLPLEFLHTRNRHRFVIGIDGTERVGGVRATRVVLHERDSPTLIKHPNGDDQPSVVRAWIDPRDGRLLRAEVVTYADSTRRWSDNSIRVEFGLDRALDLLVPSEMVEKFPGAPGKGTSKAVYTNYRRFQTSGRIVPQ